MPECSLVIKKAHTVIDIKKQNIKLKWWNLPVSVKEIKVREFVIIKLEMC